MSEQDTNQVSTLQRPTTNNQEDWKAYWQQQEQPWRTEPEIDSERKQYLAERRAVVPDIEKCVYPFKDIKLSRADVEWLLIAHENGRGPVDWTDDKQHERQGLDIRGADLGHMNLRRLPLAAICGGLEEAEWRSVTPEQRNSASLRLENANLREVHLEGANLRRAYMNGTYFRDAYLAEADLSRSLLRGAYFRGAHLEGTDLKGSIFDTVSKLEGITLGSEEWGFALLAGAHWGGADISVIDWTQTEILGDESEAQQKKHKDKIKDNKTRIEEYKRAVKANRQLSVALQSQGLNEDAARFAYRAQLCQHIVLRRQKSTASISSPYFSISLLGMAINPGAVSSPTSPSSQPLL